MDFSEYLTIPQVAERGGCSREAVRYRVLHKQLLPTMVVGSGRGILLFSLEDVDRHFKRRPLNAVGRRAWKEVDDEAG